jgi:hypothetical protein
MLAPNADPASQLCSPEVLRLLPAIFQRRSEVTISIAAAKPLWSLYT